jgi:hypothetical protein
MNPIQEHSVSVSDPGLRDGVAALQATHDEPPAIVSISDIHGYLDRARSALLSLRDRSGHDPIVQTDDTGRLQWANENYILVFNGDLIDRGPANEAVLQMVSRLGAQAPTGRVRVTLGNHEAIALSADHYPYSGWYAGQSDVQDRRALLHSIRDGFVVAAYQGYNYTYAHAGSNEPYDVEETNQQLLLLERKQMPLDKKRSSIDIHECSEPATDHLQRVRVQDSFGLILPISPLMHQHKSWGIQNSKRPNKRGK